MCSVKKVFLEISQNSQENTRARVSFLIKLQAKFSWQEIFVPRKFCGFAIEISVKYPSSKYTKYTFSAQPGN